MSNKSLHSSRNMTPSPALESVQVELPAQDNDTVPELPQDLFSAASSISISSSKPSSPKRHLQANSPAERMDPRISCTWPSLTKRYYRDIKIPYEHAEWKFEPYETLCDWEDSAIPEQWEFKAHPEGQPYYRSYRGSILFLTEMDVSDSEVFGGIEQVMCLLQQRLETDSFEDDAEVLLERNEDGTGWAYYMIQHSTRSVFWAHPCDSSWLANQIGGVKSKKHLKQHFEVEYWNHVERFPHHVDLRKSVVCELLGVLCYNTVDSLTAPRESICSFAPEEMKVLRDIVNTLDGLRDEHELPPNEAEMESVQEINSFVTSSLARLMAFIGYERFVNFHGQHGARLSRLQSIRPDTNRRILIMIILSPVLFFAPDIHLKNIEEIWIDRIVLQEPWKEFIDNLVREWEGFVLYSTVLLNANVAFLAIPAVAGQEGALAGPAEIASQVSMITSVGSVIIGLLLSRHHQLKDKSAPEAANYMEDKGLQTLAILYSLPYALLMWSMVTFVLSIAITCFDVQGVPQRAITGVIWIFIFLLIGWAVVTGWMDSTVANKETGQDKPIPNENRSIEGITRSLKIRIDKLKRRGISPSQLDKEGSIPLESISGDD